MNTELQIREWEAERDRNLRIRCPLVAAKFQRRIDKAKKDAGSTHSQSREGNLNIVKK